MSPIRLKAMREAVVSGNVKKARLLMKAGIRGDDVCDRGTKFIEYAAHAGQTELFRLLTDDGADLRTPGLLTYIVDGAGGRNPPAKDIFFYVLQQIDPAREEITDALLYAVAQDDREIVAACLERGGDPNFIDSTTFRFPLMNAVELGNLEMIRMLIDAGAEVGRHPVKDVDEDGAVIVIGSLRDFAEACGDPKVTALVGV